MYYTYVLLCKDDKGRRVFYVGYTSNMEERLKQHKSGTTETTKYFKELFLVYCEMCLNESDARKRELQLKTGFGRGYIKKRLASYLEQAGMV